MSEQYKEEFDAQNTDIQNNECCYSCENQDISYKERTLLLNDGTNAVCTFDAYCNRDLSDVSRKEAKEILMDEEAWLLERRVLQQNIYWQEVDSNRELSLRLNNEKPSLYLARGNTAAGKTTLMRRNSHFKNALNENRELVGAINPDVIKQKLKESTINTDGIKLTDNQVHVESTIVSRRVFEHAISNEISVVIDRRLDDSADIDELFNEAEKTDRDVYMIDVETPLEMSLVRVLTRIPGTQDPLPPFSALADGYKNIHKNREELINKVAQNDRVVSYTLYATFGLDDPIILAEKKDGELVVNSNNEHFENSINKNVDEEIEVLRNTVINEEYLKYVQEKFGLSRQQFRAISRFLNHTIEESINKHSLEIVRDAPSREAYVEKAMKNLVITSRTANGVIDTSASEDKASKIIEQTNELMTQEIARENYVKAINFCYEHKDDVIDSPLVLKELVENIVRIINDGITVEDVALRSGADSTKYSYTKIKDLENRYNDFFKELYNYIDNPDMTANFLAAWVEFKVDLTDHYFADGCGKIAKALSAWVMMRYGKSVPDYSMGGKIPKEEVRDNYYRYSPHKIIEPNSIEEKEGFDYWLNHYKNYV